MFSEAATRELNEELQVLVAKGDDSARQRMIASNMRLAAYITERFVEQHSQYAYYKDDLLSEAFIGLTEGVDKIRDKGVRDDPTSWLSGSIRMLLSKAVRGLVGDLQTGHLGGNDLAYTPDSGLETLEAIYACCEDDTEREIVRLRGLGRTDVEISALIKLPRLTVSRIRQRLEKKYTKS